MRFFQPYYLFLLSVVPIIGFIWIFLFRRSREKLARLIAPALQPKLMPPDSVGRFYLQAALVLAGLLLLVFAVARPQWGQKQEKVYTRGRNLLIALDVSRSMLATDVHPNRLERAKADILDLIDELHGDRAGLLAFRNKGILLCPLTTDYSFLRQALDGVSPDSAPRGETDLGDAIRKSLDALDPALDDYNAILLISDGEDLKDDAVAAAKVAADRSIPIFTVGIGDLAGATIPAAEGTGVQQYHGADVRTKLTESTLSAIATASNGRYIPLGTAGTAATTLGAIYRHHLRTIAAKEQQERMELRYQDRYQLFLIPALFFFLAAGMLSRGRLAGARFRPVAALALLLVASRALATPSPQLSAPAAATASPSPSPAAAVSPSPSPAATASPSPSLVATASPHPVVPPGRGGARIAQSLNRRGQYAAAAEAYLAAARGAERDEADEYRFNAALAAYHAGTTNNVAPELLRSLLTSRELGARAGELLGKLEMERAKKAGAEDPDAKLASLNEAAAGFQQALRANVKDERINRNYTRAIDRLPEAREAAHIAQVMKAHGKTPPDQLIGTLLNEQRAILETAPSIFTNEAPMLIAQAESLAKRQEAQADLFIPLKQHLLQAVTNQQQQMQIAQQIELGRDSMKGAASALRDILPEAAGETAQCEPVVYSFWKATAMPPALVAEDIVCQSNAIHALPPRYLKLRGPSTQPEALQLTQFFQQRFPDWAKQYRQQAQSNTNLPAFKEADEKKINELSAHALKLQKESLDAKTAEIDRPTLQDQALKDLIEIQKLLPKNPNQNQNQNQQQQQNQQNQQQQQQQQQQKQDQQKQNQQNQQDQQQPQDQKQQEKQQEAKQEEKKDQTPEDVKELLRRALDREKEHDNDKRQKMQHLPMSPSERDW